MSELLMLVFSMVNKIAYNQRQRFRHVYYPSHYNEFKRTPTQQGHVKYNFTDPLHFDYKHERVNLGIENVSKPC